MLQVVICKEMVYRSYEMQLVSSKWWLVVYILDWPGHHTYEAFGEVKWFHASFLK